MIGLLKQKTPFNIFVVFIFGILLKIPIFTAPKLPMVADSDSYLFKQLEDVINSWTSGNAFVFSVITYLLLFTQSLQLNKFLNAGRLMRKQSFVPATTYLVLTSFVPEWNYFSAPLVLNSILLFIFIELSQLTDLKKSNATLFNIGFAAGICSFVYFPSIVLFFWLILCLFLVRSIRINLLLLCVVGMIFPFYFYGTYLFMIDKLSIELLLPTLQLNAIQLPNNGWVKLSFVFLLISFLLGSYFVNTTFRQMLVQVRVKWNILILFLLFAVFILFINNTATVGFQEGMLLLIPFSAFVAVTFLIESSWVANCIFWSAVFFVVCFQLFSSSW